MSSINDRIAECVKASGLTKTAFAERINVSQSFISNLCLNKKVPSDRTISDICREFNVSEVWLRTGEGTMFVPLDDDAELIEIFAQIGQSIDMASCLTICASGNGLRLFAAFGFIFHQSFSPTHSPAVKFLGFYYTHIE